MMLTASNIFQLQGQNPYMATLNKMGDISNLCQFGWYECVYFRQHTAKFPYQKEVLGRCLGPTKNEGNEMCQWVLQQNRQIAPRRTLRCLRAVELAPTNTADVNKRAAFDAEIKERLGDSIALESKPQRESMDPTNNFEYDDEDEYEPIRVIPEADATDASGRPLNQQSVADLLINTEVLLPYGDSQLLAKVIR